MTFVLSAVTGDNSDLIREVSKIYLKDGMNVADVTYGKGVFWKQIDLSKINFFPTDIQMGVDMLDLPYENNTMDVVVIDPPYMYHSSTTHKESVDQGYQNNARVEAGIYGVDAVNQMFYDAMMEAKRVLKPKGTMWVKCQDQIMGGEQWRQHIFIYDWSLDLRLIDEDLFILVQKGHPTMRHNYQLHSRKNCSYLWIFRKK